MCRACSANPPNVLVADDEDLRLAVRNALVRCGFTAQELIAMHKKNDFKTISARLAWVAVGDLLVH